MRAPSPPPSPDAETLAETLVDRMRAQALAWPDRRIYTFLDEDGEAVVDLTLGQLDVRARAVAARLAEHAVVGDRALLLFPPGWGFIEAFLGCLYAGVVAVPAPPGNTGRRLERLRPLVADAKPRLVLAPRSTLDGSGRRRLAALSGFEGSAWVAPDEVDDGGAADWRPPALAGDDLAFLQYTSGSTANPKGVMVSHANLTFMEEQIARAFDQDESAVVVGWLPVYHDMGLIGNLLQPLYLGAACALLPPVAVLRRPRLWLETVARYRATTSGGPNFAYDLCVARIPPAERRGLDLSSWRVAFNGAEPVRAATLERFAAAFAPCGFRRAAFQPCYGLAEATLLVAGGRAATDGPRTVTVDATALAAGRVVEAAPSPEADGRHRALVASGRVADGSRVAVVDPETLRPCPEGRIGELWVAGPGVALGYWRRLGETAETFAARLEEEPAAPAAAGPYLRTGDLGFVADGLLYVTGRLKDVIILRGRNHYPQDLEQTVEAAAPGIAAGGSAAFAAEVEGEERLVVACELADRRPLATSTVEALANAVRRALAEEHEVQVFEVVLLRPGALPKTTSGKVQRRACRRLWEGGQLEALGRSRLGRRAAAVELPALDPSRLPALAAAERQSALEAWLAEVAAQVLHVQPTDLAGDRPLADLGLDSLAALEIGDEIERALGQPLPLAALFEGAGVASLAARLAASFEALAAGEPPP